MNLQYVLLMAVNNVPVYFTDKVADPVSHNYSVIMDAEDD